MAAAMSQALDVHVQGNTELSLRRKVEADWYHADDIVFFSVEVNVGADDLGIPGAMALPETVAENHLMVVPGLIFPRGPGSAQQRARTQQSKEICLGGRSDYVVGLSASAEIHRVGPTHQRHVLKAMVLRFPIEEVRASKGIIPRSSFGFVQPDQLAGILIR